MKYKLVLLVAATVASMSVVLSSAKSTASSLPAVSAVQSTQDQIQNLMVQMNTALTANGADYRVDYAEYLPPNDSGEIGQTVFFNDRGNRQLNHHFVPGDPRRGGRTNITYIVDQAEGAIDGLTVAQTTAAINRAMTTWESVNCSTIPVSSLPNVAGDIGVIEFLNGLGGSPFIFADLTHAGWLTAGILPNKVIAATFTFIFVSGPNPTDID
ncbi:MAG: hypothetical protein AAB401_06325, partial [Acidobacteriota bacterium]